MALHNKAEDRAKRKTFGGQLTKREASLVKGRLKKSPARKAKGRAVFGASTTKKEASFVRKFKAKKK